MRLSRLEIFGFKSFGKKAILEFGSKITAVVGPNGSGKSNVAEAIRFVLGEQSMKSMRGKRGEDLILNDRNRPHAPRARPSRSSSTTKSASSRSTSTRYRSRARSTAMVPINTSSTARR